ncbi:hypothetical protein [Serinibacter salmoneus]|uniref:Uncharacterized protein n=1 Tax=Serinibacter salmoneus TaxID=556530 RepID=A0A2A9CWQ6_9MICO|nr:hypothetical protein [Serinibacter salmoneus]PFG18864.1 hypothetical protein ATL40_0414 [Serinibacter salmoneus]
MTDLARVLPVPDPPRNAVTGWARERLRALCSADLSDYLELVDTYGGIVIGDFIWLILPGDLPIEERTTVEPY